MADCDLFRLKSAGPHLVNILFHAVNAALLFWLVFRLTEKLWPRRVCRRAVRVAPAARRIRRVDF